MALVSYTYSSDEDEISSDEDGGGKVITINNPVTNDKDIFHSLPEPKAAAGDNEEQDEEEQDEFLLKKETPTEQPKPKVKITLDSLSAVSDSDEDEPQPKKSRKVKGSGLFAILPPPKSSPATAMQFVPNVLKKKAQSSQPKPSPTPKPSPKAATATADDAEDSDDDDMQVELFDDQTWKQLCGRKKRTAPPVVKVTNGHGSNAPGTAGQVLEELNMREVNAAPEAEEKNDGLDNDAFKKLVGSSKLVKPNLKLIDINEEDILPDKDIWMTKALTDPECKPAHVIENPVNDTCRKKHHITYLAQQAKANEQELQNQWAASRHTRKQTQQKYGF